MRNLSNRAGIFTHEVKKTEHKNRPDKQPTRLSLSFVELNRKRIKRRSKTSNSVIREEGKSANAAKSNMFTPSRPAKRVVRIEHVGVRNEDQS